jgi:hypothetical protein
LHKICRKKIFVLFSFGSGVNSTRECFLGVTFRAYDLVFLQRPVAPSESEYAAEISSEKWQCVAAE